MVMPFVESAGPVTGWVRLEGELLKTIAQLLTVDYGVPEGSPAASRQVVRECLAALRESFDMDVAFVSRFQDGRRSFEFVDATDDFRPIAEGDSAPLEATFCARVADGRAPELIVDASQEPSVASLEATLMLPVGAHLSVPLHDQDGTPFGTLCCFSRAADDGLRDRDLQLMHLVAGVVRSHVLALARHDASGASSRTRVAEILDRGGPTMALQPIVDLEDHRAWGFEALARFPGSAEGPARWFSDAAAVGMGARLEAAAVCAAVRLLPRLPAAAYLSVNASADALCAEPTIVEAIEAVGERIVLEVTEHERVSMTPLFEARLDAVRRSGARVAVDDAGSGYAGLQHILDLRPEVLKLDRSLVDGISTHAGRQAMCAAMVAFAQRTGATLVAEGVEASADLRMLRDVGVTKAQGFLLGRPTVWD